MINWLFPRMTNRVPGEAIKPRRRNPRTGKHRVWPQEVIRAIRAEYKAGGKTARHLSLKYGMGVSYVYAILFKGIRDEEREPK